MASRISQWLVSGYEHYELVVATMDWHPPPGGPVPFDHLSDNPDYANRPLAELLRREGIDTVDVVGLATDYCVKASAMDAKTQGLSVRVLSRMIAGVAPDTAERALNEMRAAGIGVA